MWQFVFLPNFKPLYTNENFYYSWGSNPVPLTCSTNAVSERRETNNCEKIENYCYLNLKKWKKLYNAYLEVLLCDRFYPFSSSVSQVWNKRCLHDWKTWNEWPLNACRSSMGALKFKKILIHCSGLTLLFTK